MEWLDRVAPRLLGVLLLGLSAAVRAASPIDTVDVNLAPLIDAAVRDLNRFAVEIPRTVTLDTAGTWSVSGSTATWSYTVRIPTAVSLSFHAPGVVLPASAVLTVRGRAGTYTYRSADVHRGGLWSRVARGDVLQFQLTVAQADRSMAVLDIRSFQAGYRGFGPDAPDHPHYARLKTQAAATSNSSCVQNYECGVTPSNTAAAQATVGLVVGNQIQCSGTLLNDVPADQAPFVLTARHCQNGQLGGGNPDVAAAVRVYWDATTACGQPLGFLYDPSVKAQLGAVTVVEQQDAWLIELDESPVVSDAYFAGWDATGGAVQGGYTIHHALSFNKQLTGWFGQAASVQTPGATLRVSYTSNFWETVNQTGTSGPGASGSGLFDENDHLVGSLSLGRPTTDTSGYDSCPASPPPVPDGTNGIADFTSLAAVWNSTADTTSTTGTMTLRRALDPANSGQQIASSAAAGPGVVFNVSSPSASVGNTVLLSWSAPGATTCTASGGAPEDPWSGTAQTTGTLPITESSTGTVTYGLSCSFPNGRTAKSLVVVAWLAPAPLASLGMTGTVWITRPAHANWFSNQSPCSLVGGSNTLTNLPASGSTTVTESAPGAYNYALTCGSGATAATSGATVTFVNPSITFNVNANDRLLGQSLMLEWTAYADSCTPTGGAPNDGWTNLQLFGPQAFVNFYPQVTTLGTYTYGLLCASGSLSASKQVTVTVENNAPYVTFTADKTTLTDVESFTLTWASNVDGCIGAVDHPLNGGSSWGGSPQGSATEDPPNPGVYKLTLTCTAPGPVSVSATPIVITVTDIPPTATLTASATSVTIGSPLTLSWSSTNAEGCNPSGGGAGVPWAGFQNPSGAVTASPNTAGTFTFVMTCSRNTESAQAQVVVTVGAAPPPPATGGGGHGGGGAIGVLELASLAALCGVRRRARYATDDPRRDHLVR